ncbi:MAG: ORC1-type DNA replication protein [Candidatus Methanospirareceae archaeon]
MGAKKEVDMENIFRERVNGSLIFKNREVLRPTYIPEDLPHRKEQIRELADILAPALKGEAPSNVLIYGKTGTGKTATTRYVGKELEEMGREIGSKCYFLYINCGVIDTQYRVFAHIARLFKKNVPMTGWPTDQVYLALKKGLDMEKRTVIVVLDEVDKLVSKGDEALYNLSRINGELKNARVSIIGISNDLTFTEMLDARVKSSLGEEEIIFPPYNANQLRDILEMRAREAFKEGVLHEEVISLCAAFAAQEHGDARKALDLLRVSGEIAERRGEDKVREEHVRRAKDKIESDRVTEVIKTLPTQSKLILSSVLMLSKERHKKRFSTGEVYNMYRRLCNHVGIEALTQRRVTDLISELDMLGLVNAVIVSRGRYGRTKEISLSVPEEGLRSILLEDYKLRELTTMRIKTQITL